MLNVLIMVHNQFSEMLLRGVFSNQGLFKVIVVPWQTYKQSKEVHIDFLNNIISKNDLSPDRFDYVIVETNYSAPASTDINEELLRHFVDNFSQAKIIGYSGTTDSLIKALHFNPKILVLPKDMTFANEIASTPSLTLSGEDISARTVKMSELRSPGNEVRRNSCPIRIELTAETQQDMDNLVRLRSNSLPQPVTPLFHSQTNHGPTFQQDPSRMLESATHTYKNTFTPQ